MGGKYLRRWPDEANPQLTRYTPQPAEVSLVDNPCIPTATFEIVKEDGTTELRKFRDASAEPVAKAGARNSSEDLARVQAMHDTAVDLGATCPPADDSGDDNIDDAEDDFADKFVGFPLLDRVLTLIEKLHERVSVLESEPLPGGPVLRGTRTISKSEDVGGAGANVGNDPAKAFGKHLDTLPADQRALALMKFTLANPLPHAPGR
ncbi:MAG TPA: hypothetical protein VG274_09580, partial [Rhizomicrobium sp.]|jgi:hypothetical protein|nr:hypothetical protein [Rhizomicrobium sp.]